jgi:hypothetical protein
MNQGVKQIIYGVIVMVISAIISIIGVASNFGIIFYGVFIVGIILIIKGIINLIRDGIGRARNR